jgi:hypothetical protein
MDQWLTTPLHKEGWAVTAVEATGTGWQVAMDASAVAVSAWRAPQLHCHAAGPAHSALLCGWISAH